MEAYSYISTLRNEEKDIELTWGRREGAWLVCLTHSQFPSSLAGLGLLMRTKEESEKAALKLSIQKIKIMVSDPITSG